MITFRAPRLKIPRSSPSDPVLCAPTVTTDVGEEATIIPDSCDPEGFILQRMRYYSLALRRASETVCAIAQIAE